MLTVLLVASLSKVPSLVAEIESVADASVLSHTHDSGLALQRARVLFPDVLVIDLSGMFTPDASSVLDQARRLWPPCTVVVHGEDRVLGVLGPAGDVVPEGPRGPGALGAVLARLARREQ